MADSRKWKFIISIAMLYIGMTAGFLLLALVYTGPEWVKAVVAFVYFLVAALVYRASKQYLEVLKKSEKP